MDATSLRMQVSARIRAAFVEDGIALFWPDQFLMLGTEAEVLDAFAALVVAGELDAWVQVRSIVGHVCWQGTPAEFLALEAAGDPFDCGRLECERDPDEDVSNYKTAYFELSDRWRSALESTKKSMSSGPRSGRSPRRPRLRFRSLRTTSRSSSFTRIAALPCRESIRS